MLNLAFLIVLLNPNAEVIRAKSKLSFNQTFRLSKVIDKASYKYSIPQSLILAIIETESNFHPSQISEAGCVGLMQLNPKFFKKKELRNIESNVLVGTAYLRHLFDKYKRWDYALTAYNRGPTAFDKDHKVNKYSEDVLELVFELK